MPCPSSFPPGLLALMAPGLALMATFSLPSQAGDRRALPVEKPPGVKGRTLILLDVNTKSPVRIISENFLSLQLDPSIIHDGWLDFLSSRRLVTLARGLAPAFLRFAGKRTDFLQFHNVKNPAKSRGGPGPDYYLKNYEDGEPRGRGGGRALQRGAAGAGRSRSACPALPEPGGAVRRPGTPPPGTGRERIPVPFLSRERGAEELGGARPPHCRPIRRVSALGNKRPALGSGTLHIPPPRCVLPLPLPPSGQHRPQRRLCRGSRRGPGIGAPGALCTPCPALLPRLSGALPCPTDLAVVRFLCPPQPLGLPAAPPGLVTVGRRVPVPGRGCSPSGPLGHPSSFQSHLLAPAFPLLPSSPSALLPIGPQCTKGFHLSRPIIHTKKLRRRIRATSPS
uniref:Uncharacterized protein n=1 Tax=Corvus moneduloides TaxID=1196302 RepID=A0A8U7MPX8_CORMO